MTVIAVAALKGGVGKTTTAVMMAEVLAERGRTVVIADADKQGSATLWADLAAERGDGVGLRSSVELAASVRLGSMVEKWKATADVVIIDCGPGDAQILAAAIEAADLVVVPSAAREADAAQIGPVIDEADDAGVPAIVVLSRVRTNTRAISDVREALEDDEVAVAAVVVAERERIGAVFGTRPTPRDFAPFDELADELLAKVGK